MEIACECGYVARGADDEELVADAQTHGRDVHRVQLTAELVVAIARASGASSHRHGRGAPPGDDPGGSDAPDTWENDNEAESWQVLPGGRAHEARA